MINLKIVDVQIKVQRYCDGNVLRVACLKALLPCMQI